MRRYRRQSTWLAALAGTLTDDSRRRDRIIAQWAAMLDAALVCSPAGQS